MKKKEIKYKGRDLRGKNACAYLTIKKESEMFTATWSPGDFVKHRKSFEHYEVVFHEIVRVTEQLNIWYSDLGEKGLLPKEAEMAPGEYGSATLPLHVRDSFIEFFGNMMNQVMELIPTPEEAKGTAEALEARKKRLDRPENKVLFTAGYVNNDKPDQSYEFVLYLCKSCGRGDLYFERDREFDRKGPCRDNIKYPGTCKYNKCDNVWPNFQVITTKEEAKAYSKKRYPDLQ